MTPTVPALVPLVLDRSLFHATLSGLSHDVELTTLLDGREVDRRTGKGSRVTTSVEALPLGGLESPDEPTVAILGANEARLRACDAFDWINISDVFPPETAQRIGEEWVAAGKLRLDDEPHG